MGVTTWWLVKAAPLSSPLSMHLPPEGLNLSSMARPISLVTRHAWKPCRNGDWVALSSHIFMVFAKHGIAHKWFMGETLSAFYFLITGSLCQSITDGLRHQSGEPSWKITRCMSKTTTLTLAILIPGPVLLNMSYTSSGHWNYGSVYFSSYIKSPVYMV